MMVRAKGEMGGALSPVLDSGSDVDPDGADLLMLEWTPSKPG